MQESVKYPKNAEKNNVQGKVMVEFIVSSSGEISEPKILKGVDQEIDKEALRVVSEMPKWTPGEKDGKKVNVKMVLPILFKL